MAYSKVVVWAHNAEEEFCKISAAVVDDDHKIVVMAVNFPGVVLRPVAGDTPCSHQNYVLLTSNVSVLQPIKFDLTIISNPNPDSGKTWEFNLNAFDQARDPHACETIEALKQRGFDFDKNQQLGIDPATFAELLMSSGLVCNPDCVTWMTYHSAYVYGFLVKLLKRHLPDELTKFMDYVKIYFGDNAYDVKHLISHCEGLYGSLHDVAKLLKLELDPAEADSLITWKVFEKIKELIPGGPEKFAGIIYGLEI